MDKIKAQPLIGPNASDIGMGIYCRGSTFDAAHLENFIKSKTHQRFLKKESVNGSDLAATLGAPIDLGGVHQINFLRKGQGAQTPNNRTMTRPKN